jgi:hypothetical protein
MRKILTKLSFLVVLTGIYAFASIEPVDGGGGVSCSGGGSTCNCCATCTCTSNSAGCVCVKN